MTLGEYRHKMSQMDSYRDLFRIFYGDQLADDDIDSLLSLYPRQMLYGMQLNTPDDHDLLQQPEPQLEEGRVPAQIPSKKSLLPSVCDNCRQVIPGEADLTRVGQSGHADAQLEGVTPVRRHSKQDHSSPIKDKAIHRSLTGDGAARHFSRSAKKYPRRAESKTRKKHTSRHRSANYYYSLIGIGRHMSSWDSYHSPSDLRHHPIGDTCSHSPACPPGRSHFNPVLHSPAVRIRHSRHYSPSRAVVQSPGGPDYHASARGVSKHSAKIISSHLEGLNSSRVFKSPINSSSREGETPWWDLPAADASYVSPSKDSGGKRHKVSAAVGLLEVDDSPLSSKSKHSSRHSSRRRRKSVKISKDRAKRRKKKAEIRDSHREKRRRDRKSNTKIRRGRVRETQNNKRRADKRRSHRKERRRKADSKRREHRRKKPKQSKDKEEETVEAVGPSLTLEADPSPTGT